jgi:hypothetical protein
MKAVVLKPIVWNSNNYKYPSGHKATSGFAKECGYGHEEWNNSERNTWRGQQIFHTQSTEVLDDFASRSDLGMIPIASYKGQQFALGIATSVFSNSIDDMWAIAEELNLNVRGGEVWDLDIVQKQFGSKKKFDQHWKENYNWIKWRCPSNQFSWFDTPILLNPNKISGKTKLTSMHGRHQAISPSAALAIVGSRLSKSHESIKWLVNGEFDESILDNNQKAGNKSNQSLRKKYKVSGGNSTSTEGYKYWVEGNRSVYPHHSVLQSKFVKFLKSKVIDVTEDKDYIDVQYYRGDSLIYAEVKPTENIETKYAIRAAVGQLLEYQYMNNSDARLEIVLGSKPKSKEIKFVNSLGITMTYLHNNKFKTNEPKM